MLDSSPTCLKPNFLMRYKHVACNTGGPGFDSALKCCFKANASGQRPRAPGFLKFLWFAHWYVCVSTPEAINNQSGADPEGGLWGLETPPSKKCLILK